MCCDSWLAPRRPSLQFPPELILGLAADPPVVILSGSGVSAESGVPTFRDARTGLWAEFRPEDLATPEAFAADPQTVWRWYSWRRQLIAGVEPNAAHVALADWQRESGKLTIITQNVDGLHQRAGSDQVIEFHGNLLANRCLAEDHEIDDGDLGPGEPPCCPKCGALVRPGVVWFGEAIPAVAMRAASAAMQDCRFFFSIGTSSLVFPAAGFAEQALRQGAVVVEINPATTPLSSRARHRFAKPAGQVLPALMQQVLAARMTQS